MSALWWATGVPPAPSSLATTLAVVGGTPSLTQDTGVVDGQVAVITIWVETSSHDHMHILFGPTDPVGDPTNGVPLVETDQGNQPNFYLVTAAARYFRVFSEASDDIQYQVELVQS